MVDALEKVPNPWCSFQNTQFGLNIEGVVEGKQTGSPRRLSQFEANVPFVPCNWETRSPSVE